MKRTWLTSVAIVATLVLGTAVSTTQAGNGRGGLSFGSGGGNRNSNLQGLGLGNKLIQSNGNAPRMQTCKPPIPNGQPGGQPGGQPANAKVNVWLPLVQKLVAQPGAGERILVVQVLLVATRWARCTPARSQCMSPHQSLRSCSRFPSDRR